MDELSRIRKRIQQKSGYQKQNRTFGFFYHFMIVFMLAISLGIGTLIITSTPIATVKVQALLWLQTIKSMDWLVFENWFVPSTDVVNATKTYEQVSDNYYTNHTNTVYSISNGVVIYVDQNDNLGYQIIVKNDNGLLVTYSNLSELQVQLEDRILQDSILGTYQQQIYMDFLDGDLYISYEEALAKN